MAVSESKLMNVERGLEFKSEMFAGHAEQSQKFVGFQDAFIGPMRIFVASVHQAVGQRF